MQTTNKAINSYNEYRQLPKIDNLQPGDILIKKVFKETAKTTVEKIITSGQGLFKNKHSTLKIDIGNFFPEKHKVAFNGSQTSEHAAIVVGLDQIAEAVGEGVITAFLLGRREERYCVYRCKNHALVDATVTIAKGLASPYLNVIYNGKRPGTSTGGSYSISGALKSNFKKQTFQKGATADYLNHILDYVYGLRQDRPNMFCSEFVMACLESACVGLFGKTAFGTSPIGMSPMFMEDALNSRPDVVNLIGKYDSENDQVFTEVESALKEYKISLNRFFKNPSKQSKQAAEMLETLLHIGDSGYIVSAAHAFLDKPSPTKQQCHLPKDWKLKKDSTFYKILSARLNALK